MAYNLRTGLIGSGDIDVNVSLTGITADNITSGVFSLPRIPTLDDSKISDLNASKLTGTAALAQIPTLDDSKISDLNASKLTGTLAVDRIPNIPTTKLQAASADIDMNNHDLQNVHEIYFSQAPNSNIAGTSQYPITVTYMDLQ